MLLGQADTLPNYSGTIVYAQTVGGEPTPSLEINYVVSGNGDAIDGLPTNTGTLLSCLLKRIDPARESIRDQAETAWVLNRWPAPTRWPVWSSRAALPMREISCTRPWATLVRGTTWPAGRPVDSVRESDRSRLRCLCEERSPACTAQRGPRRLCSNSRACLPCPAPSG